MEITLLLPKKKEDLLNYEFFANFISPFTRRSYLNDLFQFFAFIDRLSLKRVQDIERVHVVSYRNFLQQKRLAPKSINRKLAAISSYFNFLLEKGLVQVNPCGGVRRGRQEVLSPTLDLTDEEVRRILAALDKKSKSFYLHQAVLYLLFFSGMRKRELINLKRKDFKKEGDFFVLSIRGKGGKFLKKAIADEAAMKIVQYLDDLHSKMELTEEDPLFLPTKNPHSKILKKKLSCTTIDYIVSKYAQRANIAKRISPHSARATYIGSALEHGATIVQVAQDVGHSTIKSTEIYNKRRSALQDSPTFKVGFAKEKNSA